MAFGNTRVTALCVGGPLDGQTFTAWRGGFLYPPDPPDYDPRPPVGKVTRYTLSTFQTKDKDVDIWVLEGTDPLHTMTALMDRYASCRCSVKKSDGP